MSCCYPEELFKLLSVKKSLPVSGRGLANTKIRMKSPLGPVDALSCCLSLGLESSSVLSVDCVFNCVLWRCR